MAVKDITQRMGENSVIYYSQSHELIRRSLVFVRTAGGLRCTECKTQGSAVPADFAYHCVVGDGAEADDIGLLLFFLCSPKCQEQFFAAGGASFDRDPCLYTTMIQFRTTSSSNLSSMRVTVIVGENKYMYRIAEVETDSIDA